ncbi:MAG: hypothetical protein AAFN10_06770 [Bacteroidota bacterium]
MGLLLSSCKGDALIVPAVPEIELLDVSPIAVQAFKDSIVFRIQYTDGDGDLGTNDDTERNVFLQDDRIAATHSFRLQQIAPDGADIAVRGTFSLTLPNTIITDGSDQQEASFTLYIVDQAGNESNRVTSPIILVSE